MKIFLLLYILLISSYASEINDKISEYCKIKASIFTSERLYNHEYNTCSKKLLSKNFTTKQIAEMIENEPTLAEKKARSRRYKESSEKLQKHLANQKKTTTVNITKTSDTKHYFNIDNENCYFIGLAYGVCSIRSMNNIACEPGTDFAIPQRCRGKETTHKGMEIGIYMQQSLINKMK